MTAFRIVILCLAAAIVCATLRPQRPEMAMAVSLAVGVAALLMSKDAFEVVSDGLARFVSLAAVERDGAEVILKAAGIAILSELGVQICCDAGESALAGRIRLATRMVMLGMSMPLVLEIMDSIGAVLGSC